MRKIELALKKFWGYDSFLPLQEEAMSSVLRGRDSVVILPTGGGKSLCFQAPAVVLPGMAVVVSPLISLMKDQVDALVGCGVPAARFDSSLSNRDQNAVMERVNGGKLKLLYLSPERLVSAGFIELLQSHELSLIAIDEAHCVSMWGHDFRPEYRQLGVLKEKFPTTAIHAYTATATPRVRCDIADQLRLDQPEILVGSFDRPNLVYSIVRRTDKVRQVSQILDRHRGESGIIYCIRRADVDNLSVELSAKGYRVAPYHAGMSAEDRKANQDKFIAEKIDIVVATIAFGMGIDKSNVRFVIHAAMPKSLEHYQQESGRAGRDGLEADCSLLYAPGDYGDWKRILEYSESEALEMDVRKLGDMYQFCTGVTCRHQAILHYFGQNLGKDNCNACDVCLGGLDSMKDAQKVAQQIISCVIRLQERFGADYTAGVLIGSREERILTNGHNKLSTYGLLSHCTKRITRDWIEQLVGQGCIEKTGEFNVLQVTEKGWQVLRGEETPRLLEPGAQPAKVSQIAADSWEGVDHGLFETLRKLRRELADSKDVPAYVVFGDAALRDMARRRPSTHSGFLLVRGVGAIKSKEYATVFVALIKEYCRANGLAMDVD